MTTDNADMAANIEQAFRRQRLANRLYDLIFGDHELTCALEHDLVAAILILLAKMRCQGEPVANLAHADPPKATGSAGRPRKADAPSGGRTAVLLETLRANPAMPLGDLAKAVYGGVDDEASRNRTRSLLAALKKRKPPQVRNVGAGQWEVIPHG